MSLKTWVRETGLDLNPFPPEFNRKVATKQHVYTQQNHKTTCIYTTKPQNHMHVHNKLLCQLTCINKDTILLKITCTHGACQIFFSFCYTELEHRTVKFDFYYYYYYYYYWNKILIYSVMHLLQTHWSCCICRRCQRFALWPNL